jgi:hypothetical protein
LGKKRDKDSKSREIEIQAFKMYVVDAEKFLEWR